MKSMASYLSAGMDIANAYWDCAETFEKYPDIGCVHVLRPRLQAKTA